MFLNWFVIRISSHLLIMPGVVETLPVFGLAVCVIVL
ncbi:MAG: hypothetical protein JWR76_1587 [Mucilaginibacter sp.]|nr:hypothetical protein [Mucilaginibacter sp.]